MKTIKGFLLLILVMVAGSAQALWTPGYEQGTATWYQPLGDNGYVSWECSEVRLPAVYLNVTGQHIESAYTWRIDGRTWDVIDGQVSGSKSFMSLWDAFRVAQHAEVLVNSKVIPVDVANAQTVFPPSDSPEYACTGGTGAGGNDSAAPLPETGMADPTQPSTVSMEQISPQDLVVESRASSEGSWWHIRVTSKVDSVVIEKILVNRGLCGLAMGSKHALPYLLAYGDSHEFTFQGNTTKGCEKLLQFIIFTDHGSLLYDEANQRT